MNLMKPLDNPLSAYCLGVALGAMFGYLMAKSQRTPCGCSERKQLNMDFVLYPPDAVSMI